MAVINLYPTSETDLNVHNKMGRARKKDKHKSGVPQGPPTRPWRYKLAVRY